jgi:hypothetical protein
MASTGTATIDFGSTPVADASFVIADSGVTSASYMEAYVQGDATVDNSASEHAFAAVSWRLFCVPGNGSFTLNVTCLVGLCTGTFDVRYVYT